MARVEAADRARSSTASVVVTGLVLLLIAWALILLTAYVLHLPPGVKVLITNETEHYRAYSVRVFEGMRPYADFPVEYPPIALLMTLLPGNHDNPTGYLWAFVGQMIVISLLAGALTSLAAVRLYPRRRESYAVGRSFALGVLAIGGIAAARLDLALALCFAGWLFSCSRRWWVLGAAILGLGFALKIVPVVLLPLTLILATDRRSVIRAGVAFVVAAVLPFSVFALYGMPGVSGVLGIFTYNFGRPLLEIESTWASLLEIPAGLGLTSAKVIESLGGQALDARGSQAFARLSTPVSAIAIGGIYAMLWLRREVIRRRASLVPLAGLTVVLATIALSKMLSPQYLLWLVPFVALMAADEAGISWTLLGAMFLTGLLMSDLYVMLKALELGPILLVATRNVILIGALIACVLALWRGLSVHTGRQGAGDDSPHLPVEPA